MDAPIYIYVHGIASHSIDASAAGSTGCTNYLDQSTDERDMSCKLQCVECMHTPCLYLHAYIPITLKTGRGNVTALALMRETQDRRKPGLPVSGSPRQKLYHKVMVCT